MKEQILFVLVEPFADWEAAYLSSLLLALGGQCYEVKTVSLTKAPVKSLGGFTILPDYAMDEIPAEFAGVILTGGMSWRTEMAKKVEPLVRQALNKQRVLGAICDATVFLGALGVLNAVRHTSNDLAELKGWAKAAYTNEAAYVREPAVRDGNIITANGTASMEFAREVLLALHVAPEEKILAWYDFHKKGVYQAPLPQM
jgi:putative intracellular protease/amidase